MNLLVGVAGRSTATMRSGAFANVKLGADAHG
jgi:hypothetical protein